MFKSRFAIDEAYTIERRISNLSRKENESIQVNRFGENGNSTLMISKGSARRQNSSTPEAIKSEKNQNMTKQSIFDSNSITQFI